MIAREFFETVTHPDAGTHKYIGMPWKFSGTPVSTRYSAPNLGQHNQEILEDLLGLSDLEYEKFKQNNIIGTVPIN
jgi:crotonobetainyl-CoA:carnitine CoA-transferase CaiB-like acyl-CoA transferase